MPTAELKVTKGPLPKPTSCRGCPLEGDGKGYVPADGSGLNGVLIVGEAAGETEAREGKPFVGAAGFYLNRLLKRAGLDRENFRIHNVLSCRPPENKLSGAPYEAEAVGWCRPNLDQTIGRMRPKVMVALGNVPLRRLAGGDSITRYRGFVLPGPEGSWVVPTFHPSYLLPRRGQAKTSKFVGLVVRDLLRAVEIAQRGFTRVEPRYLCDPPPSEALAFALEYEAALAANPAIYLSADIETPYKLKTPDEQALTGGDDEEDEEEEEAPPVADPILRISFAFSPHYAMSIPWLPPYLPIIQRLLDGPGPKVFWNGSFDVPVLRRNGMEVNGVIHDAMWAWHVLQSDLPRGLEPVSSVFTDLLPWKHLSGSDPALYSAIDPDAALQNMLGIERELKKTGQWNLYLEHVVALDEVLYTMGQVNGVHVDREAQGTLRTFLEEEKARLLAEAQRLVPDELKPKKLYARPREGTKEVPADLVVRVCSKCGKENVNKKHPCLKDGAEILQVVKRGSKWEETLDFNPNSRAQLMAYALHFGHPIGKNYKTKRDTLDKKTLEDLKKKRGEKHPIYGIALDLRAVSKTLGTYVIGFTPDAKGKIYTTFTHAASTGRLTSRNVNLQNVSNRGSAKYAKEVRRTIIPSPGHVFVEADSSAIEAVMVGYFMGSQAYIDLARKGVHAYLTCAELGLEFTPEHVALVKEKYKDAYDRNKITVHGTNYGMGPRLMSLQHPETFKTSTVAKEKQEFYFKACPGLADWQFSVRTLAHKQTYLVNPWGYRHYFYDVFGRDKDGEVRLADDAKRCVAFLPQSSAAAFMKDTLLILWREYPWLRPYMPANGSVHDSVCLDVPKERAEEAIEILVKVMTRPIPQMGGLRVGAEVKTGPNWADMKVVRVERV